MIELTPELVRRLLGRAMSTTTTAAALVDGYANLSRGVAAFPEAELKGVEPPLRSTPGPMA